MARRPGAVVQPKDAAVTLFEIDERYKTFRTLIRFGGVAIWIYVFMQGLAPLSGKETVVSLVLSMAADFKFVASITLTGAACAWAVVERILRQRKTKYLTDRIKRLELALDPNRSSSGLTEHGKTNPRDKKG